MSSDWIYDPQTGRRYRWISETCREWETDYIFSSGDTVPVKGYTPDIPKTCPLLKRDCIRERCGVYDRDCILKTGGNISPLGKVCPFKNRTCEARCMMYEHGCKLVR